MPMYHPDDDEGQPPITQWADPFNPEGDIVPVEDVDEFIRHNFGEGVSVTLTPPTGPEEPF